MIDLIPLIEGLKKHLCHIILWEFKQVNKPIKISRNLCSVYGQVSITDRKLRN